MTGPDDALYDVLVLGAGFGGLGACLALAEQGARVGLCEMLRYPGGCASTFSREGYRFDAGATLVSGLGPAQLFGRWLARYAPETVIDWMDPLVRFRAPGLSLEVGRDRASLIAQLAALEPHREPAVRAFFAQQRKIAEVLWTLFDEPSLLPPLSLASTAHHAARALHYAPILALLGRPLLEVLGSHGLSDFGALRMYLDALCQITVQCSSAEAEAPFALAAMDYYHRGTAHVRGGVGALATALLQGAEQAGATIKLSTKVNALRREADGTWRVQTRRGELRARAVVANLLPSALSAMLGPEEHAAKARLEQQSKPVNDAWGAVMLYAVARAPERASPDAHHEQLIGDAHLPLHNGNHVFVSISSANEPERAPGGRRTLTMSTHVPLRELREAGPGAGDVVAAIQARMKETLEARAPAWAAGIERILPASPRTFARFVGRPHGAVGGIPRKAGLMGYASLGPVEPLPRLWLVGDSVFPGQSALATATGGVRVAEAIRRALR